MRTIRLSALVLLLSCLSACSVTPHAVDKKTDQEISYLIDIFDRPDIRLVLNQDEFSGEGAVTILQNRYEHYKPEIHTAEDFIRICATNSATSGELLTVKTKKGDHPVHLWLENKLQAYRRR